MKSPNQTKSVTTNTGARELTTDELEGAAGGLIPALLLLAGCYKAGEILGEMISDVSK